MSAASMSVAIYICDYIYIYIYIYIIFILVMSAGNVWCEGTPLLCVKSYLDNTWNVKCESSTGIYIKSLLFGSQTCCVHCFCVQN